MIVLDEMDFAPTGRPGDVAVCHYIGNGAKWIFDKVASRTVADKRFDQLLKESNVFRLPIEAGRTRGSPSAAVWIYEWSEADRKWLVVKATIGARQLIGDD